MPYSIGWKCSTCHQEFKGHIEAANCEEKHIKDKPLEIMETKTMYTNADKQYPCSVSLTFANNTTKTYWLR